MTDIPFTITGSRDVDDGRKVEVTITTPDFDQMTITVTKSTAASSLLHEVIQSALRSRQRTISELEPGPE